MNGRAAAAPSLRNNSQQKIAETLNYSEEDI